MKKSIGYNCVNDLSLTYYPCFYKYQTADHIFELLKNKIKWQQERYQMFGKIIPSPRLVAWYGDPQTYYRYSGLLHDPLAWLPELIQIKLDIEKKINIKFNSVLANLYRHGSDSVSYHADNEPELGLEPTIASLSFGAERIFNLKHKTNKSMHKIQLKHGSLLIMSGKTQNSWVHSLPKEKKSTCERINLSFRLIKK